MFLKTQSYIFNCKLPDLLPQGINTRKYTYSSIFKNRYITKSNLDI
jgi:hypothetical protein